MGTRAAFWIGTPSAIQSLTGTEPIAPSLLLGCVAWDGCPESFPQLQGIHDEKSYRAAVQGIATSRDDWTPGEDGFPFPWADDLFLTDYNYIYAAGTIHCSCYYSGLIHFDLAYDWGMSGSRDETNSPFHDFEDALPQNMPTGVKSCAPGKGRDSILIFNLRDLS